MMKKFSQKRILIALTVSAVLIVTNFCTAVFVYFLVRPSTETPPQALLPAEVFARFAPSVCEINTASETGTGFISGIKTVDGVRELFIATNLHVVDTFVSAPLTNPITIQFYQSDTDVYQNTEVSVAGYDRYHDVAVLRVRDKLAQKLRVSLLSEINYNPLAAEQLMLFGNMSGDGIAAFTHSAAAVSNVDAVVFFPNKNIYELLMGVSTDVNGGASGGPILDMFGRFVGIGKAQLFSGGYPVAGASYAVPSSIAVPLIQNAMVTDDGLLVHRIDAVMKSADTLDLTELSLILQKRDGKFVVERDSIPYMIEGDSFKAGDVIESVAGFSGDALSFTRILGAVFHYSNESVDVPQALKSRYTGKSLTIDFVRDGVKKTVVYTNKKEIGY